MMNGAVQLGPRRVCPFAIRPKHHTPTRPHAARQRALTAQALPPVMVNSCTGKMGHAAAQALVVAGFPLVPFTFTGISQGVAVHKIGVRGIPVQIVGRERRQEVMESVKAEYPGLIVVDYTLPTCVNDNGAFYAENHMPFVMGTTGGDRDKLRREVEAAGVHAVVSSQMGKQVAAFQAMMELLGTNFPGVFTGYKLEIVESHQSSKVDLSGTARDMVKSFNKMGVDFDENQIVRIRDRWQQLERMGVPESALHGHAFHTYQLTSPDKTVQFVFKHNVMDRNIYAQGTVDAVHFLVQRVAEGSSQHVFDMVDVLRGGPRPAGVVGEPAVARSALQTAA